ncbi:MAG: TolB-like 6-bladed beta-propeller domain-containing protein [Tannerella sp.]|jgi:hypothetical protein|nr:TolB-like 6-bladed beta-propeller domain-containing protein [Tannerella sp.]
MKYELEFAKTRVVRVPIFTAWIVTALCCLMACSRTHREDYVRYDTFPEEIALTGEAIPLDTALFRYPFRIAIRDSVALILDLHNADHYLHAFTWPAGKHIVSFARRGEGPDELLSAETLQFVSLDSIWVLDANKMELSRWQVAPGERTARRRETISPDQSLIRSLDFRVTDTGIILPDYSGEYRYHVTDWRGKPFRSTGHIPSQKAAGSIAPIALAQAWRSFMDYRPQNDLLVMATQLGEVLELYHLNDSAHTVISGLHGEPEFQVREGQAIPTGLMGFSDVHITDRYIYAVFHGRTFKDIQQAYQQGRTPESGGRFIYVFDMNGHPVRKYTLDHAVYGIWIDEPNRTIVATDVNNDEPIIQFKIKS